LDLLPNVRLPWWMKLRHQRARRLYEEHLPYFSALMRSSSSNKDAINRGLSDLSRYPRTVVRSALHLAIREFSVNNFNKDHTENEKMEMEIISLANGKKALHQEDMDRVEFIGDALMNYITTAAIVAYPVKLTAHAMSEARSFLVSSKVFASYCRILDIQHPHGASDKVLANEVERYIGRIALDESISVAMKRIKDLIFTTTHGHLDQLHGSQIVDMLDFGGTQKAR